LIEANALPLSQTANRLPAIAAISFYWIRMKVVQQLTCLTLGRPSGPAYSTGELLNTPLVSFWGRAAVVKNCSKHVASMEN